MANIKDAAEVFIEDMIEAGENLEAFPGPIEVIAERGKQRAPHETP